VWGCESDTPEDEAKGSHLSFAEDVYDPNSSTPGATCVCKMEHRDDGPQDRSAGHKTHCTNADEPHATAKFHVMGRAHYHCPQNDEVFSHLAPAILLRSVRPLEELGFAHEKAAPNNPQSSQRDDTQAGSFGFHTMGAVLNGAKVGCTSVWSGAAQAAVTARGSCIFIVAWMAEIYEEGCGFDKICVDADSSQSDECSIQCVVVGA
jgi:hypothetical protein